MTIQLHLDKQDAEALRQILETYLGDLKFEIPNTDTLAFKAGLREKEQQVERLLAMLETGHADKETVV
jgi:hypothetical protein